MANESPDILHPLSSLEWEECPSLPVGMRHAQTVYLNGTLYVGGGDTSRNIRDDAKLYSCKPGVDNSWTVTDTPTYYYALTTYNSQLVLVGGREYPSLMRTNKIYTLVDGEFLETLPPMIEKRCSSSAVSSGSVLVVAGGSDESGSVLSSVEVFKDGKWTSAPSLPAAGYYMSSVLDGDQLYLVNWDKQVFRVSLQSLLSSTEQSPWETLPDVPNNRSAVALFGSHIVSIGGDYHNPTSSIHALSSDTQSWVHVDDLLKPLHSTSAITLPTGELMVIGGNTKRGHSQQVFCAIIKVPLVDPNIPFSIPKLFQLHRYRINLIEAMSKDRFRFHVTSGVQLLKNDRKKASSLSPKGYVELIFKAWERSKRPTYPPTWEGLFTVLRKMGLSHLTKEIGKYVTGSLPEIESSPQPSESDTEEGLSQGREQGVGEEVTLKLKAEVKRLTLENEDLGTEVDQLTDEVDRLTDENEQLRADVDSLKKLQSFKQGEIPPFEETHPELYYQLSSSTLQQPKEDVVSVKVEPQKTGEFVPGPPSPPQTEVEAKSEPTVKVVYSEKDVQQLVIENKNLRSQLALPSPMKRETSFNLPGVEVVGETSVTVTNSVQTFNWPGYGFNLHIPQDSLPAGVDQCRLRIIASVAGQYQFPDNHELVSGVYWVRPEPPCRFKQPLTAELQHCAKMTSSTKLTFVRAVCSQKSLPYTFKKLEGRGSFTDQSSYGSFQVDHFSGLAVTGENVERLYTASLYYLGSDPRSRDIHFVVNWDDEPHITNVVQFYESKKALLGHNQEVEFEDDKVSLDIPMTGTNVKGGWTIVPMFHPTVTKKQVDHFKPGRRIPHCQLKAKFLNKRKKTIPSIFHQVKLVGAKDPYNVITMDFDPTTINLPQMNTTFGDLAALGSTISTEDVSHSSSQLALPSTSRGPVVTPPPTLTGQTSALVPFGNIFGASNMDQGTHSLTLSKPARGSFPQHFSLEQSHSSLTVSPATYTPPPAQFLSVYQRNTSASNAEMPLYLPHGSYQSITESSQTSTLTSQIQSMTGSIDYPTVTFDQLVDHVGINKDHLNKPCSDEHLTRIAALLPNWQKYAEALGLSSPQILGIKSDHLLDSGMKAQQVMSLWKQANAFRATYSLLIDVSLQQKNTELAEKICRIVKEGLPSNQEENTAEEEQVPPAKRPRSEKSKDDQ